jgi:hypothetical protein
VTCPNAVSSRVIHFVFHRYQHNCFSSLDSIKLVYQHPLERSSAATDTNHFRTSKYLPITPTPFGCYGAGAAVTGCWCLRLIRLLAPLNSLRSFCLCSSFCILRTRIGIEPLVCYIIQSPLVATTVSVCLFVLSVCQSGLLCLCVPFRLPARKNSDLIPSDISVCFQQFLACFQTLESTISLVFCYLELLFHFKKL